MTCVTTPRHSRAGCGHNPIHLTRLSGAALKSERPQDSAHVMKSTTMQARFGGFALIVLFAQGTAFALAGEKASDQPLTMRRFDVNSDAVYQLCFGVGITLWEDKNTGKVMEMYVKDVRPGSSAEREGLRSGTKIYGIDGMSISSFDATFKKGSELNKIFENRKRNDTVTLEVGLIRNGYRQDTYVTLVEETGMKVSIRSDAKPKKVDPGSAQTGWSDSKSPELSQGAAGRIQEKQ